MSFNNDHPNRKDHRKLYCKSKVWDRSCHNHGSCGYCRGNRKHGAKQRSKPQRPGKRNRIYAGVGVELIGYSSRNPLTLQLTDLTDLELI